MSNFLNIAIKDKRKARIYTGLILMLFFLLLIFYPIFSYQNPPPGQQGVIVSFGQVDAGNGDEAPAKTEPAKTEKVKPKKTKPKKETPQKTKPKPTKPKPKPKKIKTPVDEKVITAKNNEIALQKQKAKEAEKAKAKQDEQAQALADQQANARAAEAAEKKRKEEEKAQAIADAAAAQKKTDDFKKSLSSSLNSGKGEGQGDTDKPGKQGDPNGDRKAEALKGLSTGEGVIGGGLQGRGGKGPGISDDSNKTGRVVVAVCIDAKGKVLSAKYTLKGSTTSDAELTKLAINNANKWVFNTGSTDTTCGTISYDFKVK